MNRRSVPILLMAAAVFLTGCRLPWQSGSLKLSGTLEFTEHSLGMPAPGRLATLTVREGDVVKKGQPIATLEHSPDAERDFHRAEELYRTGGVDRQTLERLELAMNDQRAVSPVDGVVLVKVREVGEVLAAGAPVVVVGNRREVWVKVFVPENMVSRVEMGAPATLHFDGLDREFGGHVIFVSPQAEFTPRNVQTAEERVTQTFAVKVALDEVENYLRPGVAADVTLKLRERA